MQSIARQETAGPYLAGTCSGLLLHQRPDGLKGLQHGSVIRVFFGLKDGFTAPLSSSFAVGKWREEDQVDEARDKLRRYEELKQEFGD